MPLGDDKFDVSAGPGAWPGWVSTVQLSALGLGIVEDRSWYSACVEQADLMTGHQEHGGGIAVS